MEIPLTLTRSKDGALTYGIPLWYRILSGAMFAVVAVAALGSGETPGIIGWIVLALLAFAFLYEESWRFDPAAGVVSHRSGLVMAARGTTVPFSSIQGLALTALARGTVPGSASEAEQSRNAFAQMRGRDTDSPGQGLMSRLSPKRNSINLVLYSEEGGTYLIDTLPARRAARLKLAGEAMAAACGVAFTEELPD